MEKVDLEVQAELDLSVNIEDEDGSTALFINKAGKVAYWDKDRFEDICLDNLNNPYFNMIFSIYKLGQAS